MSTIHQSLTQTANSYSVFEKDQVLTDSQLNSISQYLDDQNRLTRVHLLGVGILCGLTITRRNNNITLTAGTAITTDGDLIKINDTQRYDQFKLYSDNTPDYAPFINDNERLPLYELIRNDINDPQAKPLNNFTDSTDLQLSNMTALLFVESVIKDKDQCTGSDCDNHGRDYISQVKLLLIETSLVSGLVPEFNSLKHASQALPHLAVPRVVITSDIKTESSLNQQFIDISGKIVDRLNESFKTLWPSTHFILNDTFDDDPTDNWHQRLTQWLQTYSNSGVQGTQYFYDFLTDLCQTWNELKSLLWSDSTWCNIDTNDFAKHIVLGSLNNAQQHRFSFYPPHSQQIEQQLDHIRFLAKKLDSQIDSFDTPEKSEVIHITPSYHSKALEQRAIPVYYPLTEDSPLLQNWNHQLSQQGMADYNFSYYHSEYNAQGAAADPLNHTLTSFDFFRIEGHIGQPIEDALENIEQLITSQALPFSVTSVLIGTDRKKLFRPLGKGYNDLHRLHELLRYDLSANIKDVTQFSGSFKNSLNNAITQGIVINENESSNTSLQSISNSKHSAILGKAAAIQQKVNVPYSQYRSDVGKTWRTDVSDIMTLSGEYKSQLTKVAKTDFNTPFDNLIGSVKVDWLDKLDGMIDSKDKKADEQRLLHNFITEHPGFEHTAGVIRGGTFVLVYDSDGTVVADFMLSHLLHESVEQEDDVEVEPPSADRPTIRPPFIIDGGIKILPPINDYIGVKFEDFKKNYDLELDGKLASKGIFGNKGTVQGQFAETEFIDSILGNLNKQTMQARTLITDYQSRANDTALDSETRAYYSNAAQLRQEQLSKDLAHTAEYMARNEVDVHVGSEGYQVLQNMGQGINALADNPALATETNTALSNVISTTNNVTLSTGIGLIMRNL